LNGSARLDMLAGAFLKCFGFSNRSCGHVWRTIRGRRTLEGLLRFVRLPFTHGDCRVRALPSAGAVLIDC
jgi:hypothetical protein